MTTTIFPLMNSAYSVKLDIKGIHLGSLCALSIQLFFWVVFCFVLFFVVHGK